MSKSIIYLAGAIAGCDDSQMFDWRREVKSRLYYTDVVFNDPTVRDYRGFEGVHVNEVVDLDKRDIRQSDLVVVRYEKPSVGTSMEVLYAWMLGIPIILWADDQSVLSPWLLYHTSCVVTNIDDLHDKIDQYLNFHKKG